MNKSIDEILAPKPELRPRIYAYSIADKAHEGLLKVGYTSREVKKRVAEQLKTARIRNFTIELDESAERDDGTTFTDHEVRAALERKGFLRDGQEWMRCTVADVMTVLAEFRTGQKFGGTHHERFPMRAEQVDAVEKTFEYYQSIWREQKKAVPRFLWNAKMRFGKTFTTYQLAKKLGAKRVLVVTFKPAVEDAWHTDLVSHVDFDGWQYLSRNSGGDPTYASPKKPLVYFGSFQDLLGRDDSGNIKVRNEWLHTLKWDLVVFDEYHFGAWRETAKELFEGEEAAVARKETTLEYASGLEVLNEDLTELSEKEAEFLPITTKAYLYLSGTPFKALATGEFIEEQIFNWTYTDEQRSKEAFAKKHPNKRNPYGALPQMRLLTYQMPEELLAIASGGEFDEFDLNAFFEASGIGKSAKFTHKSDVQKWLDIIRGSYAPRAVESLRTGTRPPFPYSDVRLLPYLQHSFWFLPNVAACHAMANLLTEKHNVFWQDYEIVVAAGVSAGIGLDALPPVRKAIGSGFDTKTITLSCGKLTTGITVQQWSSILMLRNLSSPETYFQAAFRVQSPWLLKNPNGDDPSEEEIVKPVCFVFDFAPTRALRQIAEYRHRPFPHEPNPENAVKDLVSFLPVLAYDGANMLQIDAGSILDMAMSGTSATLLARKWESPLLVNVDNDTLRRVMDNPEAMAAIERIEGWRALGDNVLETIINKSDRIKELKKKAKEKDLTKKEKKELSAEEKDFKDRRKLVQEKLIKFATRIPAFMYLTDFRENTLQDVITKIESGLFETVTGLTVADFHLLVRLKVFNTERMNQAVFAFRRYEDASLRYTGIDSHKGLFNYGLYDTVVAKDRIQSGDNIVDAGMSRSTDQLFEARIKAWLDSQLPKGSWESIASTLAFWIFQKENITLDDIVLVAETAESDRESVHMVLTALTSGPHPLLKQFFYDLKKGESRLISFENMSRHLDRREKEPAAWEKWAQECRGGLEENLAMAENLYNLVERIALVLPEALNTWRAQSEQGFLDVTERLLETAIVHLEEQSKNLRSSSEDNITSSAIGFFNRYGIRASSQTNSRGHVDIYISHTWRSALVICGEAKIWRGVSYHVDGLGQVLGYCTGRLPYCFLLAYVVKGEVEKHVENLKRELDQSFPEKQQGFSVAHPSLRWALVTQHKHSGGNLVRVLHAGVKLC